METNFISKTEALLFASGDGLTAEELQAYLSVEEEELDLVLQSLQSKLAGDPDTALMLCQAGERYLLTIKPELRQDLAELSNSAQNFKLSPASYEVLATVLYNQPVTRAQVELVRGVNSDGIMTRLLERGLLEECGVLEQPGRPAVFRVTDKFMLEMGLKSAKDLAPLELLMYENIRALEEGEA